MRFSLIFISFVVLMGCQSTVKEEAHPNPILGKLVKLKSGKGLICFVQELRAELTGSRVNFLCKGSPCGYAKISRISKHRVSVKGIIGEPKKGAQAIPIYNSKYIFEDDSKFIRWEDSFCTRCDRENNDCAVAQE